MANHLPLIPLAKKGKVLSSLVGEGKPEGYFHINFKSINLTFLLQSILLIIFVTSASAYSTSGFEETSLSYSIQKEALAKLNKTVTPAKPVPDTDRGAGFQNLLKTLDSRFRGDDVRRLLQEAQKVIQKTRLDGAFKNETAYRVSAPEQFTKMKNLLYLRAGSEVSDKIRINLRVRLHYDAIFDLTNNYSRTVERDQEIEVSPRDAFVDISQGMLDLRLGKQQIVWGEALGTFITDVVNPKDLREFILPDFDDIRIPQWSAHVEGTAGDRHLEIVWTPRPKFNQVGVPGSEFAFSSPALPAGYISKTSATIEPPFRWENGETGVRYTEYVCGLNYSLFYFYGFDDFPTPFRDVDFSQKVITYRPEYERLNLFGLTFAKEYAEIVIKGEFLYAHKKSFPVSDLCDPDGVVKKDFLDYMVGIDVTLFKKIDAKIQFLQRIIANHDGRMLQDEISSTGAIWLGATFQANKIEPEILFLSSFDKKDWMIRPKIKFNIGSAWQWNIGGDFFGGERSGYFGQFHNRDRIYSEIRFAF